MTWQERINHQLTIMKIKLCWKILLFAIVFKNLRDLIVSLPWQSKIKPRNKSQLKKKKNCVREWLFGKSWYIQQMILEVCWVYHLSA